MFKDYLVKNGIMLIVYLQDVMVDSDLSKVCYSVQCEKVLEKIIKYGTYEGLTEEECVLLFKDFIEPVTYKDIDICSVDPWYVEVHNQCGNLFTNMPRDMVNTIYGNL